MMEAAPVEKQFRNRISFLATFLQKTIIIALKVRGV